ncbi:MAG: amidohydrolase family protein, partial [Phenylobacterium sp.]
VGLQTLLSALLTFHHEGRIPLVDLIASVTVRPADLLGLPCGRLSRGAPADLVLCDLNAPVVVDPDVLKSRSRNTPFDGRRLQGAVQGTFVAGRSVFRS